MNAETYDKLLAALQRQLADNERDIRRNCSRLVELMAERQAIKDGIAGIETELARIAKERIK